MDSYSSEKARREMRHILTAIERGEDVQITRYDTPTAIVVPRDWYTRAKTCLGEKVPEFIPAPEKTTGEK